MTPRWLLIVVVVSSVARAGSVTFDQINPPELQPKLVGTFSDDREFGQTFTPTISKHLGVDLYLQVLNDPDLYPPVPVELELRQFDAAGLPIPGTAVQVTPNLAADSTPGWVSFNFAQPVSLPVGEQTFIAIFTTSPRWATWETGVDADYFAGGQKYQQGQPVPIYDLVFRTRVETDALIPLPAPLPAGLVMALSLLLSGQLRLLAKVRQRSNFGS